MSDQTNVQELLSKIGDADIRKQLEQVYGDLSGSALRQQLDEAKNEVKALKAEKRSRVYRDAGVPEGAHDVLDQVYDGELTVDAIRDFASSKGIAVGEPGTQAEPETPDPAAQRESGEERLSRINAGSIPARDPSIDDQITQAEQNGDWDTYDRLNAMKLQTLRTAS